MRLVNPKGLAALVLVTAAFFSSFYANHNCEYVKFEGTMKLTNRTESFGRGIWKGELDGNKTVSCRTYQDESPDSHWKTARAFSVLGDIFAILVFLSGLTIPFYPTDTLTLQSLASTCILKLTLFQGLTLLMLPSNACDEDENQIIVEYKDITCGIGTGAKSAIASIIFWFFAGLVYAGTPEVTEDSAE